MNTIVDPYRGMTYSQIIQGKRAYQEEPHPVVSRQPIGELYWDAQIGRWVA